jgi:hypothetical protein
VWRVAGRRPQPPAPLNPDRQRGTRMIGSGPIHHSNSPKFFQRPSPGVHSAGVSAAAGPEGLAVCRPGCKMARHRGQLLRLEGLAYATASRRQYVITHVKPQPLSSLSLTGGPWAAWAPPRVLGLRPRGTGLGQQLACPPPKGDPVAIARRLAGCPGEEGPSGGWATARAMSDPAAIAEPPGDQRPPPVLRPKGGMSPLTAPSKGTDGGT